MNINLNLNRADIALLHAIGIILMIAIPLIIMALPTLIHQSKKEKH